MELIEKHSPPFLEFNNVSIRQFEKIIFPHTNWTIHEGEQWAIVGNNASGKTTLLQTIAGKYPVIEGSMHYHFYHPSQNDIYVTQLISLVNFNATQILHRHPDMFYQQRYHSAETQGNILVKDFLEEQAAFLPGHVATDVAENIYKLTKRLEIDYLLERSINKLSNGESKKLLIVLALLKEPQLLLLDYPFVGLDETARALLHELIARIAGQGTMVIIATMPDEIPGSVTHVLEVKEQQVAGQFPVKEYIPAPIDSFFIEDKPAADWQVHEAQTGHFDYAVKMYQVHVQYDGVSVLKDINWEVQKGDCWALSGHNGSGKSTLLSLITADNPQAYANDIELFDRRRGSGESIWEIKRKIGYISPELQVYYQQNISGFEVVYSGLFDMIGLPRKMGEQYFSLIHEYFQLLDIMKLKERSFVHLSSGEQRMVLLARALVKNPPLLIMDEPCQGLDNYHQQKIRWLTDQVCRHQRKTLIYVTHYKNEIPDCVTHLLKLDKGKMIYSGKFNRN